MNERLLKRRAVLQGACGFGALALGGSHALASRPDLLAPKPPMFRPRPKRVIFIFMQGGPSHVDTFDFKPELIQRDGQSIGFTGVRFRTFGKKSNRRLMKPLW